MQTTAEEYTIDEPHALPDLALDGNPESAPDEISVEEIRRVGAICERAAQGDLEARITNTDPNTEFGRMCRAINHALDMADSVVREAAVVMRNCSEDHFHRPILLRGLKGAYRKSAVVTNQAGLKMQKSHEKQVATAMLASETAASLSSVVAACEQLGASHSEISRQVAQTAEQTESAVSQAGLAKTVVASFSEDTRKIESVVTLINNISKQTNLLALNATIEAARAGEHGRGFAVVANEVKELARSSAKATEEIVDQIAGMQSKSGEVVTFIQNINASIQSINQGATSISASVTEQVQATTDISRNIVKASRATTLISEHMNGLRS